jgi:N4-bis(aminopropyl)spermidine synthase
VVASAPHHAHFLTERLLQTMLPTIHAQPHGARAGLPTPAGRTNRQLSDHERPDSDIDQVAAEVAAAVELAEGGAGVHDILTTVAGRGPVAVREISRSVEIPVPVVAAVCNELRRRGLVDTRRPVQLTPFGHAIVATVAAGAGNGPAVAGGADALASQCATCHGRGAVLPDHVHQAAEQLAVLAAAAPPARLELDQTHCTADTKLRRVAFLAQRGLLSRRIVLLGDDDLTSLAVVQVARALSLPVPELVVVDVDTRVLDYIDRHATAMHARVRLVRHDLTSPLPDDLRDTFEVAVTDPPYTVPGAALFLSRAVSALRPVAGGHLVLAFGARRPDETVRLQGLFTEMALAVRSLTPHFNEYAGAGVLGGSSHLYHLRTTADSRPAIAGTHHGPLYTADHPGPRDRRYLCLGCRTRLTVGPGTRYPHVAGLKQAGCPRCGARRFRPLSRRGGSRNGGAA